MVGMLSLLKGLSTRTLLIHILADTATWHVSKKGSMRL